MIGSFAASPSRVYTGSRSIQFDGNWLTSFFVVCASCLLNSSYSEHVVLGLIVISNTKYSKNCFCDPMFFLIYPSTFLWNGIPWLHFPVAEIAPTDKNSPESPCRRRLQHQQPEHSLCSFKRAVVLISRKKWNYCLFLLARAPLKSVAACSGSELPLPALERATQSELMSSSTE